MRIESEQVGVRNLPRERRAAALAILALWLVGAVALHELDADSGAMCWTPILMLAGTSVLLGLRPGVSLAGARSPGARGRLSIEDGVVEVGEGDRIHRFPVGDLVSGWTEPNEPTSRDVAVLVTRGGQEVRAAIPQAGDAAAVLEAAGLGPHQRAVKMRVGAGHAGATRGVTLFVALGAGIVSLSCALLGVLVLGGFDRNEAYIVLPLCAILGIPSGIVTRRLVPQLLTTTLSIGTDGVVVERLRWRRLLPRALIEDVLSAPDAVVFQLKDGSEVRVLASQSAAVAAAERIHEALRASPSAPLEALDRGGRPVAAWLHALRALGRDAGGYRHASLDVRDLVTALKDGGAPAERRIAAAVVLAVRADEESRAALRAAADTCVDERLRGVLDRAADAGLDEADLEAAVARAQA